MMFLYLTTGSKSSKEGNGILDISAVIRAFNSRHELHVHKLRIAQYFKK